MDISDIRYDCVHFKGQIPCTPNKKEGKTCPDCDRYVRASKRILIIKLGAIGDVIRTTPLVTRFRKLYPGCHITWITDHPEILPRDVINEIWKFDFRSVIRMKHSSFDISVNLDKEPEACGLHSETLSGEKFGFTVMNGHISPCTPAAEHKLLTGFFDSVSRKNPKSYPEEIFEICHLEYKKEPYLIEKPAELSKKWKSVIRSRAGNRKVIGINTGCGSRWPTRLWPEEYYRELIGLLQAKELFPVLMGGPEEDGKNLRLSGETGAWYPGVYGLKEFISILGNTDLVFSLVTMTMHLAIALEKPLILLNNIFNRNEFELFGRGEIIEPETGCDCYFGTECKREKHCMYDIKTTTVYNAILRHID
ncbi:MAG: glycosyltransferase family 9 protein [Bacteroidales bacterium]|nr:glycosyltransferase family 9 protein [Bacteroidales bacterium]